jgi:hypothetical protein
MKTLLLAVCIVLMAATAVSGSGMGFAQVSIMPDNHLVSVTGSWSSEDAGSGLDRWVLTVIPPSGKTMTGFDIMVFDPQFRGLFVTGNAPIFKAGKDLDTSFLLQKSHSKVPPPGSVNDLGVLLESEDTDWIAGAFALASGGIYDGGWSSPLELIEILVPHGTLTDPANELLLLRSDGSPEPSTLVLLAAGSLGWLAYAWRRRKRS